MKFVAIDVETANANLESICQVGLAVFSDGELVEQWSQLVDPDGHHFEHMNYRIHRIHEDDVESCGYFCRWFHIAAYSGFHAGRAAWPVGDWSRRSAIGYAHRVQLRNDGAGHKQPV